MPSNEKHARTRALFDRAVAAIASLPSSASPNESISLSNTQLLHFYSLYKQATVGDLPAATTRRPGIFDPRGRAKYDAWFAMRGTPQHVAMRQYVDLFMAFLRKFPDRPIAQQLLAEFVTEGAMASQIASSLSVVQSSSSDSEDDDEEDQDELRHQEVVDQTRPPVGHVSAAVRRRASIATLDTDAGGNSFYSATATADEESFSEDYSSSSDADDDGSETASETMVASAPDTSLISPGPVPKSALVHHHQGHGHSHGPGSSSSTTSLNTAFYRPDDTRSVTSVATVRPPPPRSPPPVPSDLGRSWVAAEHPGTQRDHVRGPQTPPATVPAAAARDFGSVSPKRAGSPPPLSKDANVVALQAQIARLQSQLAAPPSSLAKSPKKLGLIGLLRASGGWVGRWLMRSVVAWVLLATVGREMRRRNSRVYYVLEWLVKVAVGVEAL